MIKMWYDNSWQCLIIEKTTRHTLIYDQLRIPDRYHEVVADQINAFIDGAQVVEQHFLLGFPGQAMGVVHARVENPEVLQLVQTIEDMMQAKWDEEYQTLALEGPVVRTQPKWRRRVFKYGPTAQTHREWTFEEAQAAIYSNDNRGYLRLHGKKLYVHKLIGSVYTTVGHSGVKEIRAGWSAWAGNEGERYTSEYLLLYANLEDGSHCGAEK